MAGLHLEDQVGHPHGHTELALKCAVSIVLFAEAVL